MRRARVRHLLLAAACSAPLWTVTACSTSVADPPRCGSVERVAIIAQSVPSSSYVPCIAALPPGWSTGQLLVRNGLTRFTLVSDRSTGHAVEVELHRRCATGSATPVAPRTPGGRTFLRLGQIDPRYRGTMYDVFPGGCASYRFDFERGAHIALMAEFQSIVGFVTRAELRRDVQRELGVRLDP